MPKNLFAVAVGLLIATTVPWTPAAAQSKTVDVKNAWARATPGKAENGAAYLTLEASTADRLTGVSTPVAKQAELHTMTMEGTVMKMRQLEAIDLPAGQPVTLKPGAVHIMLLGLAQPLQAGQFFPLTLHFDKGGTEEVSVRVEPVGATGPDQAAGDGKMPTPAHR